MPSVASADPAAGAAISGNSGWGKPNQWGQPYVAQPVAPGYNNQEEAPAYDKLTPYGQPGPSKYNVKYGPWGNKIAESYDAGRLAPGKDGRPLQYGDGFQKFLADMRLGGNNGYYNDNGLPYSVAGGDGFQSHGIRADMRSPYLRSNENYGPNGGSKVGYTNQWGGNYDRGPVDPGLTGWDTASYDSMGYYGSDSFGGGGSGGK